MAKSDEKERWARAARMYIEALVDIGEKIKELEEKGELTLKDKRDRWDNL